MSYFDVERLIETILEGDREFFQELVEHGLLGPSRAELSPVDVEMARLAHTLVRELEVNWAGVEIIVRMRRELLETRVELAELYRLLSERGR